MKVAKTVPEKIVKSGLYVSKGVEIEEIAKKSLKSEGLEVKIRRELGRYYPDECHYLRL